MMNINYESPEWYSNVAWLSDTPGSWLTYMQNVCNPIWVIFGDYQTIDTENAMEQIGVISSVRGYSNENTAGDVQFVYGNMKKISNTELGAPSASQISSAQIAPTHILYIAGMEYQRYYGVISSSNINDLCDNLVLVMNGFRSKLPSAHPCKI